MRKEDFVKLASRYPLAAAMKTSKDMELALTSRASLLFVLRGNAFHLEPYIERVHQQGKGVVVHIDLIGGVGKDRAGIKYLRKIGVDAIITSRSQLIAAARAEGLLTIQRLLLLEDSALERGVRTIAHASPDFVEVLPGIIFPEVAATLRSLLPGPFIAGGFIRTPEEVRHIQAAGAILCSSSTTSLWNDLSL
ncbi:glycerol uptake operon antiterminator [Thermosporothrix hazakensis]|jgi:glycerol uptake operon antiterminator|uniref:Glycerol uptake operon antiterminator n=1 Tax=Thermosporothrix hazakensis TaxID=644383 RepID=A0A326U413_THEHA|nr:glycerol-3-phosphate responsive antiterminator [Thermosporothrix hazakensis]PZW27383.1 glycerol uptake operon antiterminator [Thermosporothrix hazakensis]